MIFLHWQTALGKTSKSCLCFDDTGLAHFLVKQARAHLWNDETLWLRLILPNI